MADKYQPEVQGYPLAPASVVPRSDEEFGNNRHSDEQMKKKKRIKCLTYVAVFAVFQVAVILIFSLIIMRVRTPKVRMDNVTVTSGANGDVRFGARVLVKNTNFGRYKFESTLATIRTADNNVVQFPIQEARARARSTKKIAVVASLGASTSGTLELTVEAKLRGKVEFMRVIKRKKTADMNCTLTLVLATNSVQNLRCK